MNDRCTGGLTPHKPSASVLAKRAEAIARIARDLTERRELDSGSHRPGRTTGDVPQPGLPGISISLESTKLETQMQSGPTSTTSPGALDERPQPEIISGGHADRCGESIMFGELARHCQLDKHDEEEPHIYDGKVESAKLIRRYRLAWSKESKGRQ